MNDKSTTFVANEQHLIHQIPAGLMIGDNSTELFGCRKTNKVFSISNGKTSVFSELTSQMKAMIFERLLNDEKAMSDLRHLCQEEALERFAFCVFGSADSEPDFCINGELKNADNFICGIENCTCLSWSSKKITVDGNPLTGREIEIVQLISTDLPDKLIADKLKITVSTLNSHKSNIFNKFSVGSSIGVTRKAIAQKIIQ